MKIYRRRKLVKEKAIHELLATACKNQCTRALKMPGYSQAKKICPFGISLYSISMIAVGDHSRS